MKRPRTTFPNCTPDGLANCQIIVAGSVAAEPTNAPGFDGLAGSVEVWEAMDVQ
jgi:hypothetical protein